MYSEIVIIDNELREEQEELTEKFEDWKTEPIGAFEDYHDGAQYKLRTEINDKLKFEDLYRLEIVLTNGESLNVDDESLLKNVTTGLNGEKIIIVDDIYIANHMRGLSGEIYVNLDFDGKLGIYKKGVRRPESVTELTSDQIDQMRWKRKGKKRTNESIEEGVLLRSARELFYALETAAESDKDVFLINDSGEEWKLLKVEVDEGPAITLEDVTPDRRMGGKPAIMRQSLHFFDDMKILVK